MTSKSLSPESISGRIERIPFSSWHVRTRLIVGTATFFAGFDMLAVAYALPVLAPLWKLQPAQAGLLLSALFIGELFGAPVFGAVAERFGRRRALIWATALFSVASLASGFAWSYSSLLLFRFFVGLGLGPEVPIAVSYISELSKAHGRGRFILLYEMIFPIGLVIAGLAGWWIVTNVGWRPLLVVGAAPAIIILFMQRWLPESPRWLAERGRLEEADRIVAMIEAQVERETGRPLPAPQPVAAAVHMKASWRDILAGLYLKRSLLLWVLFFGCFAVNYGLTTWLPSLYTQVYHLPLGEALRNTLVTQAVGFFGTFAAAMLIDVVGRRLWFAINFGLAAAVLCYMAFAGTGSASVLLVGGAGAYLFISAISIALFVYAPELYPTRARALGVSVAYTLSIIAGIVAPMTVGALVATRGLQAVFVLMTAIAVAAGLAALAFGWETKGKALETLSP